MKKALILGSMTQAGNLPNSARTLTGDRQRYDDQQRPQPQQLRKQQPDQFCERQQSSAG